MFKFNFYDKFMTSDRNTLKGFVKRKRRAWRC